MAPHGQPGRNPHRPSSGPWRASRPIGGFATPARSPGAPTRPAPLEPPLSRPVIPASTPAKTRGRQTFCPLGVTIHLARRELSRQLLAGTLLQQQPMGDLHRLAYQVSCFRSSLAGFDATTWILRRDAS